MNFPHRHGRGLLIICAAAAAVACSGSLFESKMAPPAVYVLRVTAPGKAISIDADLTIDRPLLGPGLDVSRIAAEFPDRRLEYFANANWSADLGDVLQSLAVQNFLRASGLRNVAANSSRFEGAYRLEITVSDFAAHYRTQGAAPTIKLAMTTRLGLGGHLLPGGTVNVDIERQAESDRQSAIVAAFEAAADSGFEQVIAATTQIIVAAPKGGN
jgi:ABC-type uncharacterized transport system auxiliary subunit